MKKIGEYLTNGMAGYNHTYNREYYLDSENQIIVKYNNKIYREIHRDDNYYDNLESFKIDITGVVSAKHLNSPTFKYFLVEDMELFEKVIELFNISDELKIQYYE